MKKHLFLAILLLNSCFLCSQAPVIQWEKSFNDTDQITIQQTSDGGYITTSYKEFSETYSNCWVTKFNSEGSIEWNKNYGTSQYDYIYSIKQTTDGGYIFSGWADKNEGATWIAKLDRTGTTQWQKYIDATGYENTSINQTADGGYIVTGVFCFDKEATWENYDCWLIKFNSAGTIEWKKALDDATNNSTYTVQQTKDGGYIFTGYWLMPMSIKGWWNGQIDYWIVKLDGSGDIQWQKTFGGTGNDQIRAIQQTNDGGYIVVGSTESANEDVTNNHGGFDCWIVKIDGSGEMQWQKSFGGEGNDYGHSIEQNNAEGYTFICESYLENEGKNYSNLSSIHFDSLGTFQCQKTIFESINNYYACSVQKTNDGGYAVGFVSEYIIDSTIQLKSRILKLVPTSVGIKDEVGKNPVTCFPNPSNGKFYFSNLNSEDQIELYDINGRLILQTLTQDANYIIDLSDKDQGVYFYKITGSTSSSGKLIKQ